MSRLPGRAFLPLLGMLAWSAAAQDLEAVPDAPARQIVESAAQQLADLVTRAVADQPYTILYVEPVPTDTGRLTRLGARLRGALQVTLLRRYRSARLLGEPTDGARRHQATRVAVELQPYEDQVAVLVRILDRDGMVIEADLIDLPRSPPISALLVPEAWPDAGAPPPASVPGGGASAAAAPPRLAAASPDLTRSVVEPAEPLPAPPRPADQPVPPPERVVPPAPVQPVADPASPQPFAPPPPTASRPVPPEPRPTTVVDDSFEPDDATGSEVPVDHVGEHRFERTLTANDRDRFALSLPAPAVIHVTIDSDFEPYLALFRPGSAVPIARLRGDASAVEQDAGTYVVQVLAADTAATGSYTLTIGTSPVDAAASDAPAERPEPEAAPGAEAPAQTTEVRPGQPQERTLREAPVWLQLTGRAGQFYSVTVRSDSESMRASLHAARDRPSFLPLLPSAAGDLVGALYMYEGGEAPLLRVDAAPADAGVSYTISMDEVQPPRVLADGTLTAQADLPPFKLHDLRVFNRDVYQIEIEATAGARAEVSVFKNPGMISQQPVEPDVPRYQLVQGDHLVLVRSLEGGTIDRVCWRKAADEQECT